MHISFLPQQMGWLDGKGIDFHPWGLKIQSPLQEIPIFFNGNFHKNPPYGFPPPMSFFY
jgi:hypothetical protein